MYLYRAVFVFSIFLVLLGSQCNFGCESRWKIYTWEYLSPELYWTFYLRKERWLANLSDVNNHMKWQFTSKLYFCQLIVKQYYFAHFYWVHLFDKYYCQSKVDQWTVNAFTFFKVFLLFFGTYHFWSFDIFGQTKQSYELFLMTYTKH